MVVDDNRKRRLTTRDASVRIEFMRVLEMCITDVDVDVAQLVEELAPPSVLARQILHFLVGLTMVGFPMVLDFWPSMVV